VFTRLLSVRDVCVLDLACTRKGAPGEVMARRAVSRSEPSPCKYRQTEGQHSDCVRKNRKKGIGKQGCGLKSRAFPCRIPKKLARYCDNDIGRRQPDIAMQKRRSKNLISQLVPNICVITIIAHLCKDQRCLRLLH